MAAKKNQGYGNESISALKGADRVMQQPRHAKGEQKVQAEALFFFCRHTNFTAVP